MRKKSVISTATAIALLVLLLTPAVSTAYTYNTLTQSPDPEGHYKTIWGFDEPEMTVGMKLGDKPSDTLKFITDASVGEHGYDMVVTDDGGGQNGKYGQITVHGVPNDFSYANPIFDLTRYPGKEKVNDFNGFEEMWIWVDATGFGDQMTKDPSTDEDIPGFDFSFQLYEQDWKDGKKVPGKFERWAVVDGGEYYIQDGSGWKTMTAKAAMMTTLPKDYKGWLRLPFDNMEIVAILGIGNMKLDLNYVVNFTLGIPMDESTIGKTMKIDSIVLYSSSALPEDSSEAGSSSAASAVASSSAGSNAAGSSGVQSGVESDVSGDVYDVESGSDAGNESLSPESTLSEGESGASEDAGSGDISGDRSSKDSQDDPGPGTNPLIYAAAGIGVLIIAGAGVFLLKKKRTNSDS